MQKKRAQEVTIFVHGNEEYNKAIETTEKLFADQNAPAESLSTESLENMEGISKFTVDFSLIENGIDIISFLAETNIFSSKGEARKMLLNGGISINRKKIDDAQTLITTNFLLHEKYLLVQKGKKNYYLILFQYKPDAKKI